MLIHEGNTIISVESGAVYEFMPPARYADARMYANGAAIDGDAAVSLWSRLCALADAPALGAGPLTWDTPRART